MNVIDDIKSNPKHNANVNPKSKPKSNPKTKSNVADTQSFIR